MNAASDIEMLKIHITFKGIKCMMSVCMRVVKRAWHKDEKEKKTHTTEKMLSLKFSFCSRSLRNVMWIQMHFFFLFLLLQFWSPLRIAEGEKVLCVSEWKWPKKNINNKSMASEVWSAHDVHYSQHIYPAFSINWCANTRSPNQHSMDRHKRFSVFTVPRFI